MKRGDLTREAARRGISAQRLRHIQRQEAGVCMACGALRINKTLCAKHTEERRARWRRKHKPMTAEQHAAKLAYMRQRRTRPGQIEREKRQKLAQYGLTADAFDAMLAAQGGLCAICGDRMAGKFLHVDHCHSSGRVRGLLCTRCNPGIGYFRESIVLLRKAIGYLENA